MLIPPLPLLNFFVALVMLSIGLRVSGGELLDILRNRALFIAHPAGKLCSHTGHRLPAGPYLPADTRRKHRHPAAGRDPGNADRVAIYAKGQNAAGLRCRHDLSCSRW